MYRRRLGFTAAVIAAFSIVSTALAAEGEGRWGNRHRWHEGHGHHHGHHDGYGRGRHHEPASYGGGYGVPTFIPGVGTYAGSISALRIRRHGTYYYAEGLGAGCDIMQPAPVAKIINVRKRKDPCSYEAGVCVIRP